MAKGFLICEERYYCKIHGMAFSASKKALIERLKNIGVLSVTFFAGKFLLTKHNFSRNFSSQLMMKATSTRNPPKEGRKSGSRGERISSILPLLFSPDPHSRAPRGSQTRVRSNYQMRKKMRSYVAAQPFPPLLSPSDWLKFSFFFLSSKERSGGKDQGLYRTWGNMNTGKKVKTSCHN